VYRKLGHNSMKKYILGFCEIKPVKISTFGPVKNSTEAQRNGWLTKVEKLGKELK
jgi:NAD(P)H dehydrogenase (quinone)